MTKGYKHNITVEGSAEFKEKINQVLELIKTAGYFEFFRAYIRKIMEIDGLTNFAKRKWLSGQTNLPLKTQWMRRACLCRRLISMKEYLEGELYYGGNAEKRSVAKRVEFLQVLKDKSDDKNVKEECERLLQMWKESSLAF